MSASSCSTNDCSRSSSHSSGDAEASLRIQPGCAFRGVLFDWKGTLEPKTPKETRVITKEQLTQQAISQIDSHLKAAGYHGDDFAAAHDEVHTEIQEKKTLVNKRILFS